MAETVKVTLPDGTEFEREEPIIKARTSTKSGVVAIAAPLAALATLAPFYGELDAFVQQVCTNSEGATRALIIAGATWAVTAVPTYITARFTKSPIVKRAL